MHHNSDITRRSIMAIGVAAALATPFTTPTIANTAQVDDWPEFAPWLASAIKLDELYAWRRQHGHALSKDEYVAHEHMTNEEMHRLCDEARQMARLEARTERHVAMLVTLAIWGADKGSTNCFDFMSINVPDDDVAEATSASLLMALGPRAAILLPEVPFGRQYAEV